LVAGSVVGSALEVSQAHSYTDQAALMA